MRATHILETVLYAEDLPASERFYTSVLGLDVISRFGEAVAFGCGDAVLLIFDPNRIRSIERSVPAHGAKGEGHIAFSTTKRELVGWRVHLAEVGVEIESEVDWGERGRSVYFRDPAGNLVELAPRGLWRMDGG